jgi:hypothetical protein
VPGCRRQGCWFPSVPGRGGRRVGCGRVACPRAGEGGRGSGGTGKPGSGGFPGSPGACTFRHQKMRRVNGSGWWQFPRSFARRDLSCLYRGGRNGGLGENLEPGRVFRGRGGSGFPPSAFPDWSSLLAVYSRSRDVVFPTSPSACWGGEVGNMEVARSEHERAGPRRKRGAQRPHTRALRSTDSVRPMSGACVRSRGGSPGSGSDATPLGGRLAVGFLTSPVIFPAERVADDHHVRAN